MYRHGLAGEKSDVGICNAEPQLLSPPLFPLAPYAGNNTGSNTGSADENNTLIIVCHLVPPRE